MKKKTKLDNLALKVFKDEVVKLHDRTQEFKEKEKCFGELKKKLYTSISNFMYVNGFGSSVTFDQPNSTDGNVYKFKVTRKQSTRVVFNPDELEKAIPKYSNKVINKKLLVNDMKGLIEYLKECGVDPGVFKSYILRVEKVVNTDQLDDLVDGGDITEEQLKGTYTISKGSPYVQITMNESTGSREDDL